MIISGCIMGPGFLIIIHVCEVGAHRPLNFYSYDIFFPRACARDHSPRRNYNNAKQPMHWTDSRHGRAV